MPSSHTHDPVLDGENSDQHIHCSAVDATLPPQQLEPQKSMSAEALQCHDHKHTHNLELGLATKPRPAQTNLNTVTAGLSIHGSAATDAAASGKAASQVSIVIQPPPTCTVNVGPKTFEIETVNLCYRAPPQQLTVPINVGALMCKGGASNVAPLAQDCSSNPTASLILKNVTCKAKAGEVLAIAGPSGAGKSTLLELLAGMIKPTSPPESIMVNRQPMVESSFRRISGYIPQHDALFPLLTVRETLLFSAKLRLPPTMSTQEKKKRVSSLMAELGLQHVADTRVGNETIRGLSGGERRRVSIGVDVIHDPCVLLLDEPTSGLDSASALNVVEMLHSMAKTRSRTIILTIHQPGYRIMQQISSFLLLAKGCVIHHGSLEMLEMRLIKAGHKIPAKVNVLEYAIDEISYGTDFHLVKGEDDDGSMLAKDGLSLHKMSSIDKVIGSPIYENNAKGNMDQVVGSPCTIAVEMQIQESGNVVMMQVANKSSAATSAGNVRGDCKIHDKPGFANYSADEVITLSQRFTRNIFRTHELFTARTAQAIVAGLALGSVYMHVGNNPRGVADRLGFFAFTLTFLFSSTVEALPIFLQERNILLRETSRGAYRISSYLIANFLVFLPFLLFLAVLYTIPVYCLIGLSKDGAASLFFVLVVWLVLLTANSFVAFLGALMPDYIMGNSVISGCMGAFFLFSGYFITKQEMPYYWRFMHYISLFKYPLDALLINEYRSLGNTCLGFDLGGGECGLTGDVVLRELGLENSSKWLDVAIMLSFMCSYRLLGYWVLRSKMCRRRR